MFFEKIEKFSYLKGKPRITSLDQYKVRTKGQTIHKDDIGMKT